MAETPALALVELEHQGHHALYVRHLVTAWRERRIARILSLVVTPAFVHAHRDVIELAAQASPGTIRVNVASQAEAEALQAAPTSMAVSLQSFAGGQLPAGSRAAIYWELFRRYATILRPSHALLMHLDICLLPIGMALPVEVPFSGILFRPSFHYPATGDGSDARAAELHGTHERFLLARSLRHPMLRNVFCLDPTAVGPLSGPGRAAVLPLVDPLPYPAPGPDPERREAARRIFGVEDGRRVLLLFGQIAPRKGWRQLVAALHRLPESLARRACLVIVGQAQGDELAALCAAIVRLEIATSVQVVQRLGYADDALVPLSFDAADIVLAPYQRHAGMSGVLLLAAAHGKPVLSQGYGLMGRLTREHGLGLTVDAGDEADLAGALSTCLDRPLESLGDRDGMSALAKQHGQERFAATLLDRLF